MAEDELKWVTNYYVLLKQFHENCRYKTKKI